MRKEENAHRPPGSSCKDRQEAHAKTAKDAKNAKNAKRNYLGVLGVFGVLGVRFFCVRFLACLA